MNDFIVNKCDVWRKEDPAHDERIDYRKQVTLMNKNDALGNRMKTTRNITRNYLTPQDPVVIRIDGKSLPYIHSWS